MDVVVIGAGIGGLSAALHLHRRGLRVVVVEQAAEIRELGVGLNVLPPAVAQLAALGLLEELDGVAVRTGELRLMDRFGNLVWSEPRGLDAGFAVPQLSIHRGRLQSILLGAVRRRLGPASVLVGHRLLDVIQGPRSVEVVLLDRRRGRRTGPDSPAGPTSSSTPGASSCVTWTSRRWRWPRTRSSSTRCATATLSRGGVTVG